MEKAGAIITTSECVVMNMLEDSTHENFEKIQNIFLLPSPDTGLEN